MQAEVDALHVEAPLPTGVGGQAVVEKIWYI